MAVDVAMVARTTQPKYAGRNSVHEPYYEKTSYKHIYLHVLKNRRPECGARKSMGGIVMNAFLHLT
jgi:hypothetical protein